ncbi:MAG TPA: hypothetical protein VF615_25795 [Longimicrobiaceae bacterium]
MEILELREGRRLVRGCRGEVGVRMPRDAGPMLAGTEVVVRGAWARYPAPAGPTRWPRDPAYAGIVEAREAAVRAPPSLAAHPLLTLRGRSEAHLHHVFPRHGALADALLLGGARGWTASSRTASRSRGWCTCSPSPAGTWRSLPPR